MYACKAVTGGADVQIVDRDLAQAGFTPARKAQVSLLEHSRGHVLAIELASIRVPFTEVRVSQDLSASAETNLLLFCMSDSLLADMYAMSCLTD